MQSSQFSNQTPRFDTMEQLSTAGATCTTYRVKLYGKLHFLKRLRPELAGDIRYREALRKEFETGYRLEHPHIVRYISLDDDSILMEYVDGETLTQRLARQPEYFHSRKNCDRLISQLLDALAYLHAHQVLHLDLKPDNVLLTRIGNDVKIIDLGCCLTDTFTDTRGHTDGFAAPEQLNGSTVDERTDIYAIGRILQLLPSHYIYNKVISRCTADSPSERYQSVADLREALFPTRPRRLWFVIITVLIITLPLGYLLLTSKRQQSAEVTEPQKANRTEEPETILVREIVTPIEPQKDKSALSDQPTTPPNASAPIASAPIKSGLSMEEEEFLDQPHLRAPDTDEFEHYKQKLAEYYSEANAFLNDTTNFLKYPSHISYLSHYQEIISQMKERIEADEWFHPLYESPMDPVSSYTRKYKEDIEHRAFINSNQLP